MQMLQSPAALPTASVPLAQLPTLNVSSLSREIRALRWIGQGGGGAVFQVGATWPCGARESR